MRSGLEVLEAPEGPPTVGGTSTVLTAVAARTTSACCPAVPPHVLGGDDQGVMVEIGQQILGEVDLGRSDVAATFAGQEFVGSRRRCVLHCPVGSAPTPHDRLHVLSSAGRASS